MATEKPPSSLPELLEYLDDKFGPLSEEDKVEGRRWFDEVVASLPNPED